MTAHPPADPPADTIAAILREAKTIAVVGLSARPHRESFQVAQYMQRLGYRILPVNPRECGSILGEPVYPSLAGLPVPVDIVNIFRRSALTDAPIDDAIAIGAKVVWLQLGITNAPGLERARRAGLRTVQDRCIAVEHQRWAAADARG